MFVQSRGRSLCAGAPAAERWSSSMVTSLSWHSAIEVLSQSLTPASNLRGRPHLVAGEPWSTVRMEQRVVGRRRWEGGREGGMLCLLCRDASEKCLAFAVREGCREGSRGETRSIRARSRALRSISPDVDLTCSSSNEDEVSLARGERVARTSQKCRYSCCIPLHGDWSHTVFSFTLRTVWFLKHVLYCMQ